MLSPRRALWQEVLMQSMLLFSFSEAASGIPGASSYVAPAGFPTSAFSSYYFLPATPTQEPQPALYDPVLKITFPANLTNPDTIQDSDPGDPIFYPTPAKNLSQSDAEAFLANVVANVTRIITSGVRGDNCTICRNALAAAQPAALTVPKLVPEALVGLCKKFKFATNATCEENFQGKLNDHAECEPNMLKLIIL
jgi:hypothetical protein